MATKSRGGNPKADKKVTRYTYNDVKEPRTPETGHTALLPTFSPIVIPPEAAADFRIVAEFVSVWREAG